jgi:2-iminobutanoate/2-iminopropanoate deaminase
VSSRAEIRVPGRPELAHSADAVRAGGLVFVAGILPVDGEGALVGGEDTVAQAEFVFAEVERILEAAGSEPADVVKLTIFLEDADDRPRINPIGQRVFGPARPASTLVEVTDLAVPGAKIEVDAIAVLS